MRKKKDLILEVIEMSNRLSKFRSEPETIEIKGVKLEISSLTFPELTHFAELTEANKLPEALNYMLKVTLRKTIPLEGEDSMSDEELDEEIKMMDGPTAMKIVVKVRELSNMPESEENKKKDSVRKN